MRDRVLIVDDDMNVLAALKRTLADEPYEVATANGGEEAMSLMKERRFKVVVSDERMPGMTGGEFLGFVSTRHPETVRIMLTGHASLEAAMKAVNQGEIYRFLTKPWSDVDLKLAIRGAMEKYDTAEKLQRLTKLVKNQSVELKILERRFPGIIRLDRDERGNLVIPEDMSREEIAEIMAECEKENHT
ncbi:MAG: response regulator [Geobacter sp.]|nr:response regulator [Geobacter sp.]